MAFKKTPREIIVENLYGPIRELQDLKLELLGTKTQVLRIIQTVSPTASTLNRKRRRDLWGDKKNEVETNMISNVVINYPTERIELYQHKDEPQVTVEAIELVDILPIEMYMEWGGEYGEDPVKLNRGDLIVDVHFGEEETEKIPIILKVEKVSGAKYSKYLVRKIAQLSLFRGKLEDPIRLAIDEYIASL